MLALNTPPEYPSAALKPISHTGEEKPMPSASPVDPGPAAVGSATLKPVEETQRISSVDILRGFALLGILVINIDVFALPEAISFNPSIGGGFTGINQWVWRISSVLCLEKMMAIFSMLFGAGVVLMDRRAKACGRGFGGIYYRRIMWLLMIGLIHAYLLWYGDILVSYALCGLLLYPLRRLSARRLIALAVAVLIMGNLIQLGGGFLNSQFRNMAESARAAREAGKTLTVQQQQILTSWEEVEQTWLPTPENTAQEIATYRDGYAGMLKRRAGTSLMMQTMVFFMFTLWRSLGLMILGMALMKLQIFSALRSYRFYLGWLIGGYAIGLPLVWYGTVRLIAHEFDFIARLCGDNYFNAVGSILVAMAHLSLVMIAVKKGWLQALTQRLAAVGRTALSNYLFQTIICTFIFYGYGLAMFARLDRWALFLIVIGVWIVQLLLSPLWLKRFTFGPAEWLWRSLTYWKRQPMVRPAGGE